MRESSLDNAIRAYLRRFAPDVFAEKRSPGFFTREGVSDWTLCAWGLYAVIETKHPRDRPAPTNAQRAYQEHVSNASGATCVAYRLEDVQAFLAALYAKARNAALTRATYDDAHFVHG